MFKRNTLYLLRNTQYECEVTLEYKDDSKLKWLENELYKAFDFRSTIFYPSSVMRINNILNNVDDLIVHEIKNDNETIFLENNVIVSCHISDGFNIINYFYENDTNCYTYIHKMIHKYFNGTGYTKDERYVMVFRYRDLVEKKIVYIDGHLFSVYYNFFINGIKIHIKFGDFIEINDKKILMKNNKYDINHDATKSTFFDFESNNDIKELLLKDLWLIRYSLSFSVLKELFKSR